MTIEAKIAIYGSLVVIVMLFAIVLAASAPTLAERATRCRIYLAETTDRSLNEIESLCKQP
jgi:hypothetical protein